MRESKKDEMGHAERNGERDEWGTRLRVREKGEKWTAERHADR